MRKKDRGTLLPEKDWRKYQGKYVVFKSFFDQEVIGLGDTPADALKQVREKNGCFLVFYVSGGILNFAGGQKVP